MPSDQGPYSSVIKPGEVQDAEPDLADEMVIIDLRIRDDQTVVGIKEYVPRAVWAQNRTMRAEVVRGIVNRWLDGLEERRES